MKNLTISFFILFFFGLLPLKAQLSIVTESPAFTGTEVKFQISPAEALDTVFSALWNPGTGDDPIEGIPFSYTYPQPGTYHVSVLINGKYNLYMENPLEVRSAPEEGDILTVPNIFTPNGDGVNDFFVVRTNGESRYSFSVFSRSGVLVYRSETPSIIWDGRTLSGIKVHPGVYYYVIIELDGKEPEEETGFVHLFR